MIIVNSKTSPFYQTIPDPRPFSTGFSSQKQYDSIKQLQNEEEISVIEWIKQNFYEYSHCRKVHKIQDLFDGIALAQIISHYLPDEDQKQNFLNQIELVEKLQTKNDIQIAANNLNLGIEVVRDMFSSIFGNSQTLVKKDKTLVNLVKVVQISMKSLQNFNGQSLIGNKKKMKNFMMQIIMILPQISMTLEQSNLEKRSNVLKEKNKPFRAESNRRNRSKNSKTSSGQNFRAEFESDKVWTYNYETQQGNYNNIEDLSSIMGYSTVHNNEKMHINDMKLNRIYQIQTQNSRRSSNCRKHIQSSCKQNLEDEYHEQKQMNTEIIEQQKHFHHKIQKLLLWIQTTYKIDISQFKEPHLLLGELVNSILAPNRLKDNEKPIKPTHYQLGSYSVYKKVLDLLAGVERLNKSSLIALMKQVQVGKVNENTFWSVIEDIQSMVKNRISEPLTAYRKQSRPKSIKKPTEPSQKFPTQYDQNVNYDNIRNQSVTQLLKEKPDLSQKTLKLKDSPLYSQETIQQTQLWLENQMGMGHPLNKSKPTAKTNAFENPLLNGAIFAKLIQRLKIGSAKGIVVPSDKKQLKNNLQIVKNELLNRGYEVARKLNIYKPSYNFYIGLISQFKEIYSNKQMNIKRQILDDKQKRQIEQAQTEIPESEKIELQKWLSSEFNEMIQQVNGIKQVSLKQLKTVIEAIVNVNFLKETTEKIRVLNYIKLLEFFRSIGFSHYCIVRVEDIVSENMLNNRKTQNLRWMIARDLRIIKGDKSSRN